MVGHQIFLIIPKHTQQSVLGHHQASYMSTKNKKFECFIRATRLLLALLCPQPPPLFPSPSSTVPLVSTSPRLSPVFSSGFKDLALLEHPLAHLTPFSTFPFFANLFTLCNFHNLNTYKHNSKYSSSSPPPLSPSGFFFCRLSSIPEVLDYDY